MNTTVKDWYIVSVFDDEELPIAIGKNGQKWTNLTSETRAV